LGGLLVTICGAGDGASKGILCGGGLLSRVRSLDLSREEAPPEDERGTTLLERLGGVLLK